MRDCLTDEQVAAFLDGNLTVSELAELQSHISGCVTCLSLVTAVSAAPTEVPISEVSHMGMPTETPGSPSLTGDLGSFEELRPVRSLGRGGMGHVFLYQDTLLDRQVAIKFLSAELLNPQARTRFLVEARALARLSHPNVVTLYRVGETRDGPYLVSEFVPGRSLAEVEKPLPWGRILSIGLALSSGLAAAHRQGIIHRDLKPGNVMLTEDDGVKLLDFGLAQLVDTLTAEQSPARLEFLVGTPRYMAPEVRRGEPATARSDVYALGLVLYELGRGVLPGEQDDDVAVVPQRIAAEIEAAGGEPALAWIIERCLHPDAAQRYDSGGAVHDALRPLGGPVVLQPASSPYRGLEPFYAEHRALFFGRDSEVRAVLDRLSNEQMVLVAGDSGVGKSSLCRAGVLPLVIAGALDRERSFVVRTLVPGRRPLLGLAVALAGTLGLSVERLGEWLRSDLRALGRSLREQFRGRSGILIFIDQAEELLTVSEPEEAALFGALLQELALPADGVRLLLTVRGDFLTRLSTLPGIADHIQRAFYLLHPLSPDGVRNAITGPARAAGVVFESGELVDTLAAAMREMDGGLPLLQFALSEMWELRDQQRGCITSESLEFIGGVAGALARHAESSLAPLSTGQRLQARRLLLQLVSMKETRIRRGEAELGIVGPDARRALDALVSARLVTVSSTEGEAVYALAHEALIKEWSTLRQWLDEAVRHRAVLHRLTAAALDWQRLGRAREALWRPRQLTEATSLEPDQISVLEAEFLRAARQYARVRRWLPLGALLAVPLLVGLSYLGVRLRDRQEAARLLVGQLRIAQAALQKGRAAAARAQQQRQEAFALFDKTDEPQPAGARPRGETAHQRAERLWDSVLELEQEADGAYVRTYQALEAAWVRGGQLTRVSEQISELTFERILLSERNHQAAQRDQLVQQLANFDMRGVWRQRLNQPALLQITTTPAAALRIQRYESAARRRRLVDVEAPGVTPVSGFALRPGSYLFTLTPSDGPVVRLPVLLSRGETRRVELTLPQAVPAGMVYVPPGCFLYGSSDDDTVRQSFFDTVPLHERCTEGYLIGQHEVTFGDWLAFLRTLPEGEQKKRVPGMVHAAVDRGWIQLRQGPEGRFQLAMQPAAGVFAATEGEPIRYPDRQVHFVQDWLKFPVSGVSYQDAEAYVHWLSHSGQIPRARICGEDEWERAGRGADGRLFPHGDQLAPGEANFDETYGRRPLGFGPDEVGTHPESASPFGLHDMAGNAMELTRSIRPPIEVVFRGGAWYHGALTQRLYNRTPGEPGTRNIHIGFRVCADAGSLISAKSP